MDIFKNRRFFAISILHFCLAIAFCNDSIPTKELQEVEVKGERAWISEDGTLNFIPSKKEKKLSNSPGSLIKAMNIPMLRENGTGISLLSGESVEIFINGEKADNIDLSTFWPMDVTNVQYIENPKDSKYRGAVHVVNFITRRYAAGGVSRTEAYQEFPNSGIYSTSSKVVYKKMTFGAMATGQYSREHQASRYGETIYKDLYYDNVFFEKIARTEESSDYQRDDYVNCAVNAKYTGDRFIATHTLSLGWRRNPGSGSESTGTWTDNLFNSAYSSSRTSLRSIYPQISGNYYVKFSEKWHLPFSFEYIFSKNDASSSSCFGETPEINNTTGEKINTFTLEIDPWVKISKKMYLQMIFMSRLQWFDIDYSGSADERHTQSRIRTVAKLKLGWNPTRNLNITFNPGVDLFRRSIGDIHECSVLPTANTSVGWRLSRKYSLNCSLLFGVTPPTARESNPVLVKSSELMWVQGNPNLKNSSFWDVYLTNNLLLKDGVSLGGSLGYYYSHAVIVPEYEAAPQELGGLVMKNVNAGGSDHLRAAIWLRWSAPRTGLSMSVSPNWRYSRFRDQNKNALGSLSLKGEIKYTFGNCMADFSYSSPSKRLDTAGMERLWTQDKCDIGFSYGNGNLFLSVKVKNIFHQHLRKWRQFDSYYFATDYTSFETGRKLSIDISYTFGFGRKVDRNIDISGPNKVESGVNL